MIEQLRTNKAMFIVGAVLVFSAAGLALLGSSSAGPQDPNDPNYPLADTNGDNQVNIFDLSYMLSRWGTTDTTADFNSDGSVSIFDLSYLLAQWGRVDTPGGGGGSNTIAESNYLQFDGQDDYVSLGGYDFPGSALTIEALIDLDDLNNCTSYDCRIVSKATSTSEQDHYVMLSTTQSGNDAVLRFRLKAGGTTTTLVADTGILTGLPNSLDTYHVAATYDGATMRLFLDGVEVGSQAKTGAIDQNPAIETWIGGNPDSATVRPWKGSIDDVRIWDVARSEADILANSTTELTGSESGLTRYYKFNETTGQTLTNSAATGATHNAYRGSTTGDDANDPSIFNNTPDVSPPTAPTNVTSPNQTGNTIELDWTASTDDRGIARYIVQRDGSDVGTVTSPDTTFTDTGLSSLTTYTYTLYAEDAADNRSPASTNLTIATTAPDTQDPSVPSNFTVSNATASTVALTWDQSTDNIGVASYVVTRDGSDIATVPHPTTTYTDSNLNTETSYTYTVRAADAAGNTSAQTAAVTGTTLNLAGTWEEAFASRDINTITDWYDNNTGIAAAGLTEGDLTAVGGGFSTTQDGQVIDGLLVNGTINIKHDNVIIRNTKIVTSGAWYAIQVPFSNRNDVTKFTVENVSIEGFGCADVADPNCETAILSWPSNAAHVSYTNIRGHNGGIRFYSGARLHYNSIKDIQTYPGSHNTAMSTRGGSDYEITRSYLSGSTSSAVSLYSDSIISHLTATENIFDGGTYSIRGGTDKAFGDDVNHIVFTDNLFTYNYQYGPLAAWCSTCPGNVWSNNLHLDGTPAP